MAERPSDNDSIYRVEYPVNVQLDECMFRCIRCDRWRPASYFGLYCGDDDVVRNRSVCETCRAERKCWLSLVQ